MTKVIQPLNELMQQYLNENDYSVEDSFATLSSTFYSLVRRNENFYLKIDQTNSGAIKHQMKLSMLQKELGLPFIECIYADDANRFLIMKVLDQATKFKQHLNEDLIIKLARSYKRLHEQSSSHQALWVEEYGEFMNVSHKDCIYHYIEAARNRFTQYTYEQEQSVREILDYLENNINHLSSDISFIHGDAHLNNVLLSSNEPVVIDPQGMVLYGSKYLDLALLALEFPGWFDEDWSIRTGDKYLFDVFLHEYGEIDYQQLYYYIALRGSERFAFDSIIPNVSKVTMFAFDEISGK